MRVPLFLLALVAGVSASAWSDADKVSTTAGRESFHGPGLIYKGEVWNGDKTKRFTADYSYIAKSVITGKDSYYPKTLPATLKTPYLVADSTHPNLAFWYSPDAFESEGMADGAKVSEWKSVANICYEGFKLTQTPTTNALDIANDCTSAKKSNSQTVVGGNNKHVESLKQDNPHHQPIYKKNVANGHGVVRFRRADKHGFDGQFLEMHKRCADFKCAAASTDSGFVPLASTEDWTNGVAAAGSTAFTISMVMKTYQTPGDVNPMGILNIVKGADAKKGLGLYKTASKCQPVLKSAITAAATSGTVLNAVATRQLYLTSDAYGTRSTQPGAYNGMYAHILGHTDLANGVDPQTGLTYTSLVCKIDQYLVVGYVKTTLTGAAETEIVLEGGAGKVMGQTVDNSAGQYPTIRFGQITAAGTAPFNDAIINAVAAENTVDTKITLAAAKDFSANNLKAGTAIYFAVGAVTDEFYTTFVSECTGTQFDGSTANSAYADAGATTVEIIPGDGVSCKGDKGAGLAPFGRLSTLTGYYGAAEAAALDDAGDSGCETECSQFGCDPNTGDFYPKYIVGKLKTALNADNLNTIELAGGAGKVLGWTVSNGLGQWPTLRFGSPDAAHASGDVIITGAAANGVDTDLTVADYDAATNNVAAGTLVYFALGADTSDFLNRDVKGSCVKKWGSARSLQDPDDRFRVVTVRVSGTGAKIYIDGLHDGCEGADTSAGNACGLTPPAEFAGVTAQQLDSLRLGVMSVGQAAGTASSTAAAALAGAMTNSFANVDIAEMLIYNTALSPEEMDRVGNYLAVKYDISQYKLNSFIRSPTRTVAVSAGAGCDHILFKPHQSSICDGFPGCASVSGSPIAGDRTNDLIILSRRLADSDTDDYYIGMRLVITGGGASKDGFMLSAKGQSCRISDYASASRSATCDLSNTGLSAYLLWGGAVFPDLAGTNAVAATDTLLTVTWVPTNWNTPYFAKIGDPTGDCEVVKVMSVGIVGNKYQLTVIRNFAGQAAGVLTWAHSKAFNVAATITYSRSVVMRDIAAAGAAGNIVMSGFISSCGVDQEDPRCALASDVLPLSEPTDETKRNLQIKVTPKTANQGVSVAVKNLRPFKWTLAGTVGATAGFTIDPTLATLDVQDATGTIDQSNPALNAAAPHGLAAGDLLLLGSLADGEVVRIKAAGPTDADTVPISRGHALDRVMTGRPTWTLVGKNANGDQAAAGDTTFVVSTAFTAPVNSLLLCGTVAAGTVGAGSATENEIVKVTAIAADGVTLTVARGDGRKPDDSAATTAAIQVGGTTLTLLTKVHDAGTPVTLIGKDGEPLIQADLGTANAGANAMTLAEGTLVDFAIKPLGGRTALEGSDFVGNAGVSTYKLEPCDPYLPPYVTDAPIQIVQGQEYLKSPGSGFGGSFTADTRTTGNAFWASADGVGSSSATGPVSAPASGGTVLELKGWYLAPSDLIIESGEANYDTAGDKEKYLFGTTTERNENYLLVTVGARPSECADPTQTTPCADGKYENREAALDCNIVETPSGYCALDWTKPCKCPHNKQCADECGGTAGATNICKAGPEYGATTAWYPTAKTSMRCALPGTLNANQNLNIYWHGVKTTFTNWYRPHAPVVTQLTPSSAVYSGGDTVTITGSNFGPRDVWTAVNKAGTKTTTTRTATVSLVGKGMAKMCDALVYVSDKQLICKVPALANQKQDMNKAARTVAVSVVVDAGGLRTRADSSGTLQYSNVPTYFSCDSNQVSETGKNECFSCCRSACIVDEFAQGAQKGGATYSHCDTACYKFCGFNTK